MTWFASVGPRRRALLLGLPAAWVALPLPAREAAPIRLALIEGLSGAFANAGDAVMRNVQWACERVNRRGGVKLPGGARPLRVQGLDSKGTNEEALAMLRAAIDQGCRVVMQGNSSAIAAALIDAIDKHNLREPARRVVFLNYAAVDPALTRERCSFWHFRFDADADMRLDALTEVLREDRAVQRVYLIGQDYSFGQQVAHQARALIGAKRPEVEIVGDELHPLGRVKDFMPYALKIKASGAQAVLSGNWGNDLTLLVKALREAGSEARLYTFYGNALGAPAAIGEAGVGRVLAVAEWQPNLGDAASQALYAEFRRRFPDPRDDYLHVRMQVMIEMLAAAIEQAGRVTSGIKVGGVEAGAIAHALEGARFDPRTLGGVHEGLMRAADHQLLQPLVVSVMARAGTPGVAHDVEGSGFGFRVLQRFDAQTLPSAPQCRMQRPE
jgi:branched-chain amino acid transport system substrate-binding protein